MTERLSDSQASREALSALADGQAQASDVSRACAAWREDADARASWQAYHLIGDVMRSDDLAQGSGSADFLAKFRDRLAQEPVVLAPASAQAVASQPTVATAPTNVVALKRRTWAGPMAVAASFVMVVGAVVTLQMGSLFGGRAVDNGQLAQSSAAGRAAVVAPCCCPSLPCCLRLLRLRLSIAIRTLPWPLRIRMNCLLACPRNRPAMSAWKGHRSTVPMVPAPSSFVIRNWISCWPPCRVMRVAVTPLLPARVAWRAPR